MNTRISLIIFAFLATTLLFGCATTTKRSTASGKPEVIINSTDKSRIKSAAINRFMDSGFILISDTEYNIVLSKPWDGAGGLLYQVLLGNAYSTKPEWNIRLSMVTLNNSTRIVAQSVVKMKNGFGREEVNDMTAGKSGEELQQMLRSIKAQVETGK